MPFLLLLQLDASCAESLQTRSECSRLIEVVARHRAIAAVMLKRGCSQPVEFAGKLADLPLQLLVCSAETVALHYNDLDLASLSRAAFSSRQFVFLSEPLRLAIGSWRAGRVCFGTVVFLVAVFSDGSVFAMSLIGGVAGWKRFVDVHPRCWRWGTLGQRVRMG